MNAQRLEAVRRTMKKLRLDAMLVTFLPHVRYLTGFSGSNGLALILPRKQCFFSDGRYTVQASEEVRGWTLFIAKGGSLFEELKKRRVLPRSGRVGFEAQYVRVAEWRNLKALFPGVRIVETSQVVESAASVKEEPEIDLIRRAVSITDRVFTELLTIVREGIAELDVAAEISYLHRTMGADSDAFEPIVASGPRGALPHARASAKKLRQGELVTLDFGCCFRGYHSDLTRTVAIGKPDAKLRKLYDVVFAAQSTALEAAREGVPARDLDRIARRSITKAGYGKYFNHSLGHGLGLQVHELPRVSSRSADVLRAGNVVTVEPGVYVPGTGGVRIEDDVVIRDGTCEILTTSSRELIIL